jgi:hypothetical protein
VKKKRDEKKTRRKKNETKKKRDEKKISSRVSLNSERSPHYKGGPRNFRVRPPRPGRPYRPHRRSVWSQWSVWSVSEFLKLGLILTPRLIPGTEIN